MSKYDKPAKKCEVAKNTLK